MVTTPKKMTLTSRKASDSSSEGTRRFSTRAKDAARRDGRELPIPKPSVRSGGNADPLMPVTTPKRDERKPAAGGVKPGVKFGSKQTTKEGVAEPRRDWQKTTGDAVSGAPRQTDRRSASQGRPPDTAAIAAKPFAARGSDDEARRRRPGGDDGRATAVRGDAAGSGARRARDGSGRGDASTARSTGHGTTRSTSAQADPNRNDRRHNGESRAGVPLAGPTAERVRVVTPPTREPDGMIRVSKLLSEQGLCSRREADSYIARGWVLADGVRVIELGTRVLPTAVLTLDENAEAMQEQRMTILLNKPIGYVSGQAEDGHQPASVLIAPEHQVADDVEQFRHEHRRGLAPAGRLDIDSTGLLVLTQDGRVAKHLIGEKSGVEKEYLVRVEGTLGAGDLERLRHGLSLDGEALRPAKVRWQNEDQLNFILKEGKKRQIRRMCELVGLKVVGLKRIRIGGVVLGDLPIGKWRFLRQDEVF